MSTVPAFSRMQLAAALIEYDNDQEDPSLPRKSAQESAIFQHLRRANGNIYASRPDVENQDFLGVKLPTDSGRMSDVERDNTRKSKASVDLLRNPFGEEEEEEDEHKESDLEVDLKSWGLDSIIPEEKPSKKSKAHKGKAKSEVIPKTAAEGERSPSGEKLSHSRTMSLPLAEFGQGGAFLESSPGGGERRNSLSGPLVLSEVGVLEKATDRKRFSSHPLIEDIPVRPPLLSLSSYERKRDTVPFPTSPRQADEVSNAASGSRPASRLDAFSESKSNPFSIPPPPPSRASRFDPKSAVHARTTSNATRLSVGAPSQLGYFDDNNDAMAPRAPSRASFLDANAARGRRTSTFSIRTQDMLNDDYQSIYAGTEAAAPREKRYSRMDLMRPKLLVMPSPLQNIAPAPPVLKPSLTPSGFIDSSDGPPLPPGSKSSRMSVLGPSITSNVPVPSNSFTPNPRLNLTASQLLFRNTLLVDGQRDVTYNDIDGSLKRATKDGEQAKMVFPDTPVLPPVEIIQEVPQEPPTANRPAGKLYGRSLIDDLEAKKQSMKSKKRNFTGDQRPSMMDRGMQRSSTLIDPGTLPSRPTSMMRIPSSQTDPGLTRSGSKSGQPLLSVDDSGNVTETLQARNTRMLNTRSVFGVDTLWEREMAKLKEIEEQERLNAEEARKKEEEEEERMRVKKNKKGKKKSKKAGLEAEKSMESLASPVSPETANTSVASPQKEEERPSLALPEIPTVTTRRRAAPVPDDDDSDGESSASEVVMDKTKAANDAVVDSWVSDDEKKPPPPVSAGKTGVPQISVDSDDEDVPLSRALQRVSGMRSASALSAEDDSDEDRPLSMLILNKSEGKSTSPTSNFADMFNFDSKPSLAVRNDKDDDDEPLGIRASRLPAGASQLSIPTSPSSAPNKREEEDDRPLSMHPNQIRKSQFNLFAQMQQQQQQQQMLQAQMANQMAYSRAQSMMFMMQPPAFTPAPQMQMPVQMPMANPEPNKFSSVDRWRHDVAVEGQE